MENTDPRKLRFDLGIQFESLSKSTKKAKEDEGLDHWVCMEG